MNPPLDIERRLGTTKRGSPWPRLAVPFVLVLQIEIMALIAAPGILALVLGQVVQGLAPLLAVVLGLAGTYIMMVPVGLFVVVGAWCLLPERRTGGFLLHPGRLWAPSIATWIMTAFISGLVWEISQAPAP